MQTRTAERIESWDARPYAGGADVLAELAAADFSGVVAAGGAHLFFVNGRVITVAGGTVADVVAGTGEIRSAPERSLALLLAMHESDGEPRARYYTNETALAETDEALRDAGFTGYVELSENVLSGDYYVAYYGGRSFPVAFVGNRPEVFTGEEAFERAADEVGVYEVVSVDLAFPDLPEPEEPIEETDVSAASVGAERTETADATTGEAAEATTTGTDGETRRDTLSEEASDAREVPDELAIAAAGPAETTDDATETGDADDTAETSDNTDDDETATDEPEAKDGALAPLGTGSESPTDSERVDLATEGGADTAETGTTDRDSGSTTDSDASITGDAPTAEGTETDEAATTAVTSTDASDAPAESETAERAAPAAEYEERLADLHEAIDEREERIETLSERAETAEATIEERERALDRLREERDDLRETVATLEDRVAELEADLTAAGGRVDPATERDPETVLAGTNLFVRYESKAEPTLDALGEADPDAIDANLRLEHHTSFDAADTTVAGDDYRTFLEASAPYRFVSWVVRDLPFEIAETGHQAGLEGIYESIPDIDRAELDGTVERTTEDGETVSESFDVVLRDGVGEPLAVAALNTGRDPVAGGEMEALTAAASTVCANVESLSAAFYVTASFFGPDALETANDATASGGFLRRSEKESYVKVARKRGYHLCLVEDRDGSFHVTVPEL